jgi:hypothetical protein
MDTTELRPLSSFLAIMAGHQAARYDRLAVVAAACGDHATAEAFQARAERERELQRQEEARAMREAARRERERLARVWWKSALRPPISTLTTAPLGLRSGSAISAPSGSNK